MIQLMKKLVLGEEVKDDPELGIGSEWAWQIPIYKNIIQGASIN